jgi:large subunit ribosomal protein L21
VKARLALIWAAVMAAGVTVVGVLTGRRRKRRAQRQQAREQRRAKKAQRRAQGGGRRPGGAPARSSAAAAAPAAPREADAPAEAVAPATAVAPAEPSTGPSATTEAGGDDLRAIKGLGAVAAEKLHGAGVTTWAQIAAWTPDEARDLALRLDLQPGRIASDDWVGQARALVEERDGGSAPVA